MRIIAFFLLLLFPFISKGQSKFEPLRKQLIENKTYEYVYQFENNYAVFRTFNNNMGLIDSLGNVIIKPNYRYIDNKKDLKNLFEAAIIVNKKYKRGFIDLQNKIKIPFDYDDIFYLGNGLIRVSKTNKTGVLDTENKIIIPLKYDYIQNQNGILFVQTNNTIDLFDAKGKQLTNFKAADIDYFKSRKSIVTLSNKNTFIIDDQGYIILNSIKNHQFETIFTSDAYLIKNTITKKKGVINSSGQYEIECKYDEISPSNSIYIIRNNEKSGIVDKKDSVLKPLIYDHIFSAFYKDSIQFQNQYFADKGNLKGIINPFLQNDIIPFKYKNIQIFSKYYVVENLEEKNGLFSENGEIIIDEKYKFHSGFKDTIFASKDNKNYLLTIKGKNYSETEIPVDQFVKNYSFFGILEINKYQIFKNKNKLGVISTENKIVIPCEFDEILKIYPEEFILKRNQKYGIVNTQNQVVLEIKYDSYTFLKESISFEIKDSKEKVHYPRNYTTQ